MTTAFETLAWLLGAMGISSLGWIAVALWNNWRRRRAGWPEHGKPMRAPASWRGK